MNNPKLGEPYPLYQPVRTSENTGKEIRPSEMMTALDGIAALLDFVDDSQRDGLKDTPQRVVKAFIEMTAGYREDPKEILSRIFEENNYDQMIVLEQIEFTSLCEHHLLPFSGTAAIGYIPSAERKHIVGISKLARLVECFARRLQVQERLTHEIAGALETNLRPEGVGVILRAVHSCMSCRGIKRRAPMTTSVLFGSFRDDIRVRQEFLNFCRNEN